MASCSTARWANTSPYVTLTVNQSASSDTNVTLSWTLTYYASSAAETSVNKAYTVTIAGATVKEGTYNINGRTGTHTIASGTKIINKTKSTQTISFGVSFTYNLTWAGVYRGTLSASGNISVAALPSYTIAYNANGGSGAPSSQSKWYGDTLKISTTSPSRTGYTFKGWATSSGGSVAYASGANYTANSSVTLYAVWQAITYTITYNANGGSGAPSSQTKTYGVALILSSTKPTRTNYNFLGWSTSSAASTATYKSGGSFTLNQATVLYAVWELAYVRPKINNLQVKKSANYFDGVLEQGSFNTISGALTDSSTRVRSTNYMILPAGTYTISTQDSSLLSVIYVYDTDEKFVLAESHIGWSSGSVFTFVLTDIRKVKFGLRYLSAANIAPKDVTGFVLVTSEIDHPDYRVNYAATVSYDYECFLASSSHVCTYVNKFGQTVTSTYNHSTASGTNAAVHIGSDFIPDYTYTFTLVITDALGSSKANCTLPSDAFPIDCLMPGLGIAFGKTAELEGVMDVAFKIRSLGGYLCNVLPEGTDLNTLLTPNNYASVNKGASYYTNIPSGLSGTFTLEVLAAGAEGQILQRITMCDKSNPLEFMRLYYQGAWGNWIRKYPVTLFTGSEAGVVTFSESVANFKAIDIFFTDNNGKTGGYTRVYDPDGKAISLSITEAGSGVTTYIRRTSYTVSGTTMTPDTANAGYVRMSSTSLSHTSGTNYLRIVRVMAYETTTTM